MTHLKMQVVKQHWWTGAGNTRLHLSP